MIRYNGKIVNKRDIPMIIGKEVVLSGRISKKRVSGKNLSFAIVDTHVGDIQCVFENIAYPPNQGSIIRVHGILTKKDGVKSGMPGLEIIVRKIEVLYFQTEVKTLKNDIRTRVENRHLDLRNPKISLIFETKSAILKAARDFLTALGYCEVYSSKLAGSSTEGPLDAFVVDYFGNKVFLSVSNVLSHFEIIAGGIPKIFEIGPCFRGTRSKTNRHVNEFTMLDFSASFMDREEFMEIAEDLTRCLIGVAAEHGYESASKILQQMSESKHFELITYREAIETISDTSFSLNNGLDYQAYGKLAENFKSFLWITDFPEEQKSFYVKTRQVDEQRLCCNFQLWHPDIGVLIDGAERVSCFEEAIEQLTKKRLDPKNFKSYLNTIRDGMPPSVSTGLTMDRLTQLLLGLDNTREVILFPRDNKLIPL